MLSMDESLMTTVHYYRGAKVVDFSGHWLPDRAALLWQGYLIAERVAELQADSVAVSAEIWYAFQDEDQPGISATDRQDRREALSVQAVRSDGIARLVMVPFSRVPDGSKVFDAPIAAETVMPVFKPLRELWGLRRWWILIDPAATTDC